MSSYELLEDEWLIVRNSGEIPEITYHACLYYLEKDPLGPGLVLTRDQKRYLIDGAVERYKEIILRDIYIENYCKTIYRGIRRTIYNWYRFQTFCKRQDLHYPDFGGVVAEAFLSFLDQGMEAAGKELPQQFLNCSIEKLLQFAREIDIDEQQLAKDLVYYCQGELE